MSIPIIDLFAGPGGLSEGFAQICREEGDPFFRIGLSVEKDKAAHRTLKLRSFFRQFPYGKAPDEYYDYLRQGKSLETLYSIKKYSDQAESATRETWCAELGSGSEFNIELNSRISQILVGNKYWVLIGGPPCQAYSVAGRSRNKGVKDYVAEKDKRHFLYREYLQIIARHKPTVFVMENVKGLLSSKVNGNNIFEHIISDLKSPFLKYPASATDEKVTYRIFSLAKNPEKFDEEGNPVYANNTDFVICSERYGIPQARHRVILLGIREDYCPPGVSPDILKESENRIDIQSILENMPAIRSGLSRRNNPDGQDSGELWIQTIRKFPFAAVEREILHMYKGKEVLERLKKTVTNITPPQKNMGGEFIPCTAELTQQLNEWYLDQRLGGVLNHSARTHIATDLFRYLYASCFAEVHAESPKMNQFPDYLKPDHRNKDSGFFIDRFRVQISERPSSTITSHISKDGHYYIHYDPMQCRSLTVREAARLQTFPDNYFFCGARTNQYVQVGNAVPPLLAEQIAAIVIKYLNRVMLMKASGLNI